jgi:hypothetical protein
VRRHQEENRNYKCEAPVHLASDTRCLLHQISQMASVLYIRNYYSDFLIREEDEVPSSGTSPAVFSVTLIFTVVSHIRVITQ